jgi:hypothetical protein
MSNTTRLAPMDSLRLALPAQAYLKMLSQVALTGTMPILDCNGNPTQEAQPCTPQMRYDALKYLTDKIVPQAKAQDVQTPPDLEAIAARSQILKSMSIRDLIALRDQARAKIAVSSG